VGAFANPSSKFGTNFDLNLIVPVPKYWKVTFTANLPAMTAAVFNRNSGSKNWVAYDRNLRAAVASQAGVRDQRLTATTGFSTVNEKVTQYNAGAKKGSIDVLTVVSFPNNAAGSTAATNLFNFLKSKRANVWLAPLYGTRVTMANTKKELKV